MSNTPHHTERHPAPITIQGAIRNLVAAGVEFVVIDLPDAEGADPASSAATAA